MGSICLGPCGYNCCVVLPVIVVPGSSRAWARISRQLLSLESHTYINQKWKDCKKRIGETEKISILQLFSSVIEWDLGKWAPAEGNDREREGIALWKYKTLMACSYQNQQLLLSPIISHLSLLCERNSCVSGSVPSWHSDSNQLTKMSGKKTLKK